MKTRRTERETRSVLRERLEARRSEIEAIALTRVKAIADPSATADPAYAEGLRAAVAAAIDYGLHAIEYGGESGPPIPVALLGQARIAARNAVSLDTVLRRYFAGYSLLAYFLIEEANRDDLMGGPDLQRLLATQAGILDRLLEAVSEEHTREARARAAPSRQRLEEQIERLLEGELVDTSDIAYDFGDWHLGVVATGADAAEGVREIARDVGVHPLLIDRGERELMWVWFGGRQIPDASAVIRLAGTKLTDGAAFAMGEPAQGVTGWRLTHRQALAALAVAQRCKPASVRYGDVALLASVIQDDLLTESLRKIYRAPLEADRDRGATARETLCAYFAAERNATSAAAALGISRQAVNSRLQMIEDRLERPIHSCSTELEVALGVWELESPRSLGRPL